MTDVRIPQLRIFAPGEVAVPAGWPDDVGIAALLTDDDPEIFPIHGTEDATRILARLEALSGRNLGQAAVFPVTDDHQPIDLSFSAAARLQAGIEAFLAQTPEAVEEAADFSVNFGFATDEGLDPANLVRASAAVAPVEPVNTDVQPELPGYRRLDAAAPPFADARPAMLWRSDAGDLVLLSDPDTDPVWAQESDILVREDGLGLALRRDGIVTDMGMPGYLVLPPSCLAFDPPASGCPMLVIGKEMHFLVVPSPGWINNWAQESISVPSDPDPTTALRRLVLYVVGLAIIVLSLAVLSGVHLGKSELQSESREASALPVLREKLFP